MKNFMYSIGKKAIIASKNKINSKSKNKVLNQYINLIKKVKKKLKNEKVFKYTNLTSESSDYPDDIVYSIKT